jgi:hypothetical protein
MALASEAQVLPGGASPCGDPFKRLGEPSAIGARCWVCSLSTVTDFKTYISWAASYGGTDPPNLPKNQIMYLKYSIFFRKSRKKVNPTAKFALQHIYPFSCTFQKPLIHILRHVFCNEIHDGGNGGYIHAIIPL